MARLRFQFISGFDFAVECCSVFHAFILFTICAVLSVRRLLTELGEGIKRGVVSIRLWQFASKSKLKTDALLQNCGKWGGVVMHIVIRNLGEL